MKRTQTDINKDECCDIVVIDNNKNGHCSRDHTEATIKSPAFNQVLTQYTVVNYVISITYTEPAGCDAIPSCNCVSDGMEWRTLSNNCSAL